MQVHIQVRRCIISLCSLLLSLPQGTICLTRNEKVPFLNEGPLICLRYCLCGNRWRTNSCLDKIQDTQGCTVSALQKQRQPCWSRLFLLIRSAPWPFPNKEKVICLCNVTGSSLSLNTKTGKIKWDEHDCHFLSYPSALFWRSIFVSTKLQQKAMCNFEEQLLMFLEKSWV